MTRMQSEEEAILALGRACLAPNAADRARVRSALDGALAAALAAPSQLPEANRGDPSGATSGVHSIRSGLVKAGSMRLLATTLTFALGGGLGYWAGYGAGIRAHSAPSAPRSPALPIVTPTASGSANGAPSNGSSVAASASSAAVVGSSAPRMTTAPRASSPAPRAETPAQPLAVPEVAVDEELRTLQRAERALRQGNPRLSLVLLEELARSTQGGRLLEERAAEMAVARCTLEPSEAERLSLEFEHAHPNSVYASRVEQSCGRANVNGSR